ncbi:MAG TPA: aldose 1-epimerase family protein [Planctomycetaceae bacterium]|nr:aldose 1-epimerase family protein [Planctomycetaceae bacterium]
MAVHQFSLSDVARGLWHERFAVAAGQEIKLAGSDGWSVEKRTLRGGVSEGVEVVDLNNGRLAVSILPTRGMGIWRGTCDGLELGWKSPVAQPVHPAFVNALDRGGIGWLAGFNEWICRCGLDLNGPPGPDGTLHGRIANIPAHQVDVAIDTAGPGTISVTGVVDEAMMFGPNLRLISTLETVAGSNRFTIIDEITNRRGVPAELELLYHINTGRPFLEPGARCVVPAIEVAPRDPRAAEGVGTYDTLAAPQAEYAEQVYYFELAAGKDSRTAALLRNAHGDKGISLHFDRRELPHFTLWKNTQAEEDGYVCGLEPATNFPNLKGFERQQGRVIRLPPGGKYTIRLEVAVHSTADGVREIEKEIARLQGGRELRIHRQPREGWSAG